MQRAGWCPPSKALTPSHSPSLSLQVPAIHCVSLGSHFPKRGLVPLHHISTPGERSIRAPMLTPRRTGGRQSSPWPAVEPKASTYRQLYGGEGGSSPSIGHDYLPTTISYSQATTISYFQEDGVWEFIPNCRNPPRSHDPHLLCITDDDPQFATASLEYDLPGYLAQFKPYLCAVLTPHPRLHIS